MGCSDDTVLGRVDAGRSAPRPPVDVKSYLPDLDAIVCEPTLASIQANVFGVACGFDSCHGSTNAAWGLALMEPDVAQQLIGVRAKTCAALVRVEPGSPDRSFLWHKVADSTPPCGERMPMRLGALPSSVVSCFTDWIRDLSADASTDAALDH